MSSDDEILGDPDHIETWDLLDITLLNQEADYRRRFSLDSPQPGEPDAAAEWRLASQLDRLAPELVKSVASLTVSGEAADLARELAPGDNPKHSIRHLIHFNVVRERLAIELAGDAIDRLHNAEQRFLLLVHFLREHSLGPTAASYVDRAVRLFWAGFGPECVVMCRSALDAVLTSVLPDEEVADLLGRQPRSRNGFMLADRIDAASRAGLLTNDEVRSAHKIREFGRDAVHLSPGLAPEPTHALFPLIILLAKLVPDAST